MTHILWTLSLVVICYCTPHGMASSSSSSSSSSLSAADEDERLKTLTPVPDDKAFLLDYRKNMQKPTLPLTVGAVIPPSLRNLLHFSLNNKTGKAQSVQGYRWDADAVIHICLMLGDQKLKDLAFSTPIPMPLPLPQEYTVSDALSVYLTNWSLDAIGADEPFRSVLERIDDACPTKKK